MPDLRDIFPVCSKILPSPLPEALLVEDVVAYLSNHLQLYREYPFIHELARLELAIHQQHKNIPVIAESSTKRCINPSVELLEVSWNNLPLYLQDRSVRPEKVHDRVLLWYHPKKKTVVCRSAAGADLLALKIVSEELDSRQVAKETKLSIGTVNDMLYAAEANGLLLAPRSLITRSSSFPRGVVDNEDFFSTPTFTLQWHITQNCDLHCRHCYDRSDRKTMPLQKAIQVLDDLYDFCTQHHVFTQVTFTGGNPLLYPHFDELYQEAVDRGFLTAILGNPMQRDRIEPMLAVRKPEFYQISLEGLETHNDYIRGKGHFQRSLQFLDLLSELGIFSMVMLTLTRDNQNQVLELAEFLRGKVDLFTFNRLAMVGEGATLASAPTKGYRQFLEEYQRMAKDNPHMRLKDNLFNLVRHQCGEPYVGGCAGHGCGAAFNFISLLPDGEVHACRKLPSKIGNLYETPLNELYQSTLAKKYRSGPAECRDCPIRPVCGGCLAVSYGFGLDIFEQRDPYCFLDLPVRDE